METTNNNSTSQTHNNQLSIDSLNKNKNNYTLLKEVDFNDKELYEKYKLFLNRMHCEEENITNGDRLLKKPNDSFIISTTLMCGLKNYRICNSKTIRKLIKNKGLPIFEIVFGKEFVKPYLDIDIKEGNIDYVKNVYNDLFNTIKSKINFCIGGYTNINNLGCDYIEYKPDSGKALSLHIYGLTHYTKCDKVLAYWLDYVGINVEYAKTDLLDTSVYKDYTKQQKFRLCFSHKKTPAENGGQYDNKNIKSMYIISDDDVINFNVDDSYELFNCCLITYISKNAIYLDLNDNLNNQQYRDKINNKEIKKVINKQLTDNKTVINKQLTDNKTVINKQLNDNKTEEDADEFTPLYNNEELLNLLNLFDADFKNFKDILSPLANSPYPLNVLQDTVNKWYNYREREKPQNAYNYITKYYKYTKNNVWFYTIIDKYFHIEKVENLEGWSENNEKLYKKYKNKRSDYIIKEVEFINDNGKPYNPSKKTFIDTRAEIIEDYMDTLLDKEENKTKYYKRKELEERFLMVKRLLKPYEKSHGLSYLFRDRDFNYYTKDIRGLKQAGRENAKELIKDSKINKKDISVINPEICDYIIKYNGIFITDDYIEKAKETLNIFKEGFITDCDYMFYIRWLAMKFNNPDTILPKNIVCLMGSGSFKTTFMESFIDFIKVSKINYSVDTLNSFNEWIDASIVMIDEIPQTAKEISNIQNTIKQITSTNYVKINRKFEHERTIKNHANYIINSNFLNCGGLFNNQSQNEIFRRFKIIKKQSIEQEKAAILYNNLRNPHILYNLYNYIKKEFKPLTITEFNEISEYEIEYMQFVKNTEDNKHVLSRDTLIACVDTKKRLRLKYLVDCLKNYGYNTSMATEKTQLLQNDICRVNGNHLIINNKEKFMEMYLNDESEEDKENFDVAHYLVNDEL